MGDDSIVGTEKRKKKKSKDKHVEKTSAVGEADKSQVPKKKKKMREDAKGTGLSSDKTGKEVKQLLPVHTKIGKKRKRKIAGDAPEVSADEEARRRAQKEIQQLVVKLRAEGKTKQEIEAAKRDLKKNCPIPLTKPDSSRAKKTEAWKQWMSAADEPKPKPDPEKRQEGLEHKHDLVIIPVIWRGRHDHEEIQKAAEDVKATLAQQGLDVWVDSRRHYTPGQKFAHWEFRGVMIRIEIGPEDFQAGMLKLCKAKEAGDYQSVEKMRLRLPPRGNRKLLLALKDWGLEQIEIERREGDDSDEEDAPAATVKESSKDDDLTGNWAPRVSTDGSKKKKKLKS